MLSKFFSGFSLQGEKELFQTYLSENDFTVCGFSYGAQQAFDYVLNSKDRVDLLQLFSPAFFQDKDLKYKRMQLMYFKKDALNYCSNFLDNSVYPTNKKLDKYFRQGSYEDLDTLLNYEWKQNTLEELLRKGTKIEVYLGAEDKIINTKETKEFFQKYASIYVLKNTGHILN